MQPDETLLKIDGDVRSPRRLTFADLSAIDPAWQLPDVGALIPGRHGTAVKLAGLLELVDPREGAGWLGLHASRDDFHASIPLAPVRDTALVIYARGGEALDVEAGGPLRFFIPDFAACHTDEIDECANVKFVDHLELTREKGHDNRPEDDEEHEALHGK